MKRTATVSSLFALGSLLFASTALAQHFSFVETNGSQHTLLVISAEIDGSALVDDDEIGVFTPGAVCAGAVIVSGNAPYGITAWGADEQNPGFESGQAIEFRIWDNSANTEFVAISTPSGLQFEANGNTEVSLVVQGEAAPEIEISDPDGNDFGQVSIGSSSQWTFDILNIGGADLHVSSVTSNDNAFTTDFANGGTVSPQGSRAVAVTFTPTGEGSFGGLITVSSDDGNEQTIDLSVTGVGVAAGAPDISLSSSSFGFGEINIGSFGTATLTISNTGSANLNVTNISDNHQEAEVFTTDFDNQNGAVINPNGSIDVELTFTPSNAGLYEASLEITSNDPQGVVSASLSGTGIIPPHFSFVTTGTSHTIFIQSAQLDGAPLDQGLQIGILTPSGVCAGSVELGVNQPPVGLPAYGNDPNTEAVDGFAQGESFDIRLWDPNSETEWTGYTYFIDGPQTWQNNAFTEIELTFQGNAAPELSILLNDLAHDYTAVAVGASADWTFVITNTGRAPLTIQNLDFSGADADAFSAVGFSQNSEVAANGGILYVTIRFSPDAATEFSATLGVNSDDGNESPLNISLSGSGTEVIEPEIDVTPASIVFGNVDTRETVQEVVTVANSGTGTLTIGGISLVDVVGGAGGFSFAWNEDGTIEPNESRQVTVTFAPGDAGDYSANLQIDSDDDNEAVIVVQATGSGIIGDHFRFSQTNTSHSVVINEAILDGQSLVTGDMIGVFTPGGTCAGAITLPAQDLFPAGFAAFGADGETPGFTGGDAFDFRVWDASSQNEYNSTKIFVSGPQTWQSGGVSTFRLNSQSVAAPEIEIAEGDMLHDFNQIAVGATSEWELTIGNLGGANLVISNISTNSEFFTTDFTQPITVDPNGTTVVTVLFSPDHADEFGASLVIASNDFNESEISISLFGIGTEVIVPEIVVDPLSIDFGSVDTRDQLTRDVSITNTGTGTLTLNGISVESEMGGFSFDWNQDATLEPNESRQVSVTFAPDQAAQFSGMLIITSDDEDEATVSVELSGVGVVGPHFLFASTGSSHSLLVTSALLDGEPFAIGDEIGVFTPGGLCAGAAILDAADGVFPAGLGAFGDDPNTEALDGFTPGEAFSFVVWDASTNTEYEPIAIYDNGSQVWQSGSFTSLHLNAQSVAAPEIDIANEYLEHSFGQVAVNGSSSWQFVISNVGGAELMIHSITSNADEFSVNFEAHTIIQPNGSVAVTVTFSPPSANEFSATLTVSSDDADEGSINISLFGIGTEVIVPEIVVAPLAINFGEIDTRNQVTEVVTITNDGTGDLTIDGIVLVDVVGGGGGFSLSWNNNASVAPGDSRDVSVTFAPDESGDYSATLRISSNDENESVVDVSLSGSGVVGPHFLFASTGTSHSLLINSAELDGMGLEAGAEIGVFTPAGLCAGATILDDADGVFPAGFAAFGDDQGTEQVDGFSAGEAFSFTIWDDISNTEYDATPVYVSGPENWQNGGVSTLRLNAQSEAAPEIDIAEGDLAHNFGEVAVGDSRDWELTINNIGGAPLTISNMSLENEAYGTDFAQAVQIAPNESAVFTVTFTPSGSGDFTDVLTIASDDENESPIQIDLSGSGTLIVVPEITVSPLSIDFGDVDTRNEASEIVTITNDGTGALTISSIGFTEEQNGFTFDWSEVGELTAGASVDVTVTFAPPQDGDFFATLRISSDDDNESVVDVELTGTGFTGPHFTYLQTGTSHSLLINTAELDGEEMVIGDEIGVFTPAGICAGAVILADRGGDGAPPRRAGNVNFNIFPAGLGAFGDDNGTETVEGFTAGQPFAFRLYDASIDAEFNATVIFVEGQQSWLNGGFTVVRLSAQSEAAPEIDLSAVSHEFGEVFVGALRNWAFDIQNIGGATLTIYSVTSNDNDVFSTDFSGETSIDPNSALTVDVTFGPDAAGDFSGTLTIVSNDGNESEVTVSLTGTGTEERIPDIAVAPESLAFGNIAIGRNSTQTVTISNNGTGDLTLTAVTLSGEGFSMTDNGESNVITPGNSQDIDITFTPTQVQEYQGNLTIESDDADEGEIVVNLSGAGVLARHFEFGQTNTNHSILISRSLF